MKTVYDLIQNLSRYPANAELQIVMFLGNDQGQEYLDDSRKAGQEWSNVFAEPLRLKQSWNTTVVTFECQACDL